MIRKYSRIYFVITMQLADSDSVYSDSVAHSRPLELISLQGILVCLSVCIFIYSVYVPLCM